MRGAEVGDLAVGMDPDLGGREGASGPPSPRPWRDRCTSRRAHRHRRARRASGQRRGHAVACPARRRRSAPSASISPWPGPKRPDGRHALDRLPARVLRHQPEADHVALLRPATSAGSMASDAGAADATSTTVVARTPPAAAVRVALPGPARLEHAAARSPARCRARSWSSGRCRAHVALRRVAPSRRAAPAGRAPAGPGGSRSRSAWPGPAATFTTTIAAGWAWTPGTSAVTSDEDVADAAGADHAGGVDLGGGEALLLEEDGGVGDRPARGIEGPGGELERVADRELEAGGGDLQAAAEDECYRAVAGRLRGG